MIIIDWLGLGGAALGAASSIFNTNSANSASEALFEKQMAFNKEVMQNRHQWEVSDLKAAGLNPLMSVASPTGTLSAGSAPTMQKADIAQSAAALGQLSIANKQAEAASASAQANLINARTAERRLDFDSGKAFDLQSSLANSTIGVNSANEANIRINSDVLKMQLEWQPKLYAAGLNKTETEIVNSLLVTAAQVKLMGQQGQAALMSASAAQTSASANVMSANAALKSAASLESLNLSKEDLNRVDADRISEETRKLAYQNIFNDDKSMQNSKYFGDVMSNILKPLTGIFGLAK